MPRAKRSAQPASKSKPAPTTKSGSGSSLPAPGSVPESAAPGAALLAIDLQDTLLGMLPRAAALVHHGGIGTTSQALAAGCPQLIMPMAHDQRDNAHHVADLRAGDWIKRSRYRAKNVAVALAKLINNPVVKHHCERAAGNFVGVKSMARTCDEIEMFALTTPPTVRRTPAPGVAPILNSAPV